MIKSVNKTMVKKIILSICIVTLSLATSKIQDIQNPKTAVKEVLRLFKTQMNGVVTKTTIQIPYNITYNILNDKQKYFVSEFQIKILYKTIKSGLNVSEKNYIIRFLYNNKNKNIQQETYSLVKESVRR